MILLELVPRDKNNLLNEAKFALNKFPMIQGINIPDLLRFNNRSYDIAKELLNSQILAIPHIRSIDQKPDTYINIIDKLLQKGLKKILIISGDKSNLSPNLGTKSVIELIKIIKASFPTLKVYAGLDPYRQSLEKEIKYAFSKLDAGAEGFFTQPFFDIKTIIPYANKLKNIPLFIGITPILTEPSRKYWVTKNKVNLPHNFELSLEFNILLAKKIMTFTKKINQNSYIMPIKTNLYEYLSGIFHE